MAFAALHQLRILRGDAEATNMYERDPMVVDLGGR